MCLSPARAGSGTFRLEHQALRGLRSRWPAALRLLLGSGRSIPIALFMQVSEEYDRRRFGNSEVGCSLMVSPGIPARLRKIAALAEPRSAETDAARRVSPGYETTGPADG